MKKIMEASRAVAEAVKLSRAEIIPMYPITPQTHIVEALAEFINNGEMDASMIHMESEHSALSAAIGSEAVGLRTFTATSSQGLALMHEVLFNASGLRLPIVMAVANRSLSAPINIWNDHQDSISSRDSGWIQLFVESSQEALDTTIIAFKIAEKTDTPVMVCLDGYTLSHVYEPVDVPTQKEVDTFLPPYKPEHVLDPEKPVSIGPIAFPNTFMEFKKQQCDAMDEAPAAIREASDEFRKQFSRSYGNGLIETYNLENAKSVIIAMGTICGTIRVAIEESKKPFGLISVKSFRPFPHVEIAEALKNIKRVAVIDRDVSPGSEAALFTEVKALLAGKKKLIKGYIAALGGRDFTREHFKRITKTLKSKETVWLQ